MRSAVSVILSSPVPDNKMSQPDYEQTAYDHAAILVLLKQVGSPLKPKVMGKLSDRIVKCGNRFTVVDSNSTAREIFARFVKEHPVENNEFGNFQTHRKLLGMITFGKYENQIELDELCRQHESLKVKYHATLFDSRAVFMGPVVTDQVGALLKPPPTYKTPENFKTNALFYGDESCSDLESHVLEFLNSLFYVLESKRLERTKEKPDKLTMLTAPFEKKDFIGADS